MRYTPSPAKSRILYLTPVPEISGAEMSLLGLLRTLNWETFEPLVALPGPGPLGDRVSRLGVEAVTVPQRKLKARDPVPYLNTVFRLTNVVRRKRIDLIHSNTDIGNQYGVVAARLSGVPIVCHTRNILSERPFRRMFLRHADRLIANSYAVAASYSQYVKEPQRMTVIYNGVDLEEFSPGRGRHGVFRRKLGLPHDAFVIGHIARISAAKAQHTLVAAMAQVCKNHPKAFALFVGDTVISQSGDYLISLKQSVQDSGLAQRLLFAGFVDEIVDLYADLDLVVLPSKCEPFGRTIIEAMSMGVPVVANSSGGPLEIIENGQNGFLVDTEDPGAFAGVIEGLIVDRSARQRIGKMGRETAKRFSMQETTRCIESIYGDVLNKRAG